jgi:hypothetical protein
MKHSQSRGNYTKPKKKVKMNEVIVAIHEDVTFAHTRVSEPYTYKHDFDGYAIETNERIIKVGVENGQSCCEDWGYLTTNDTLQEFVGAKLLGIKLVDTALKVEPINEKNFYEASTMFVNFETDRGTMQLVAYNDHNGYYGHDAVVLIGDSVFHREVL